MKALAAYFEADDDELCFDDVNYIRDAREKANAVVALLKNCGWLEYEQEQNHQLNVALYEYAIPVIEAMNRVIKEEEAEYQGIISQIHAGDIDVGGCYILEHLKAKTGIPSSRPTLKRKNSLKSTKTEKSSGKSTPLSRSSTSGISAETEFFSVITA